MRWETFGQLIKEHLSFGTMLLLLAATAVVLFTTLFAKDLRWSIALLFLVFIFNTIAHPVVHMIFYILRWVFLILITFRLAFHLEHPPRASLVHILFLLWAAISIFSAFQAPSIFRGVAFGFTYFLAFTVFFLLIPVSMTSEQEIKRWFRMLIYVAIVLITIPLVMYVLDPWAYVQRTGRIAVLYASPVSLATSMLFSSTLFLWIGLESRGHILRQIICYTATFSGVFLMFLTGTRGSLAAFAIFLMVLCFHYRMKMAVIILPLLILGSIYIVPRVMQRATKQFATHLFSTKTTHRPALRELAFERIRERPILGWGLGSASDFRSPVCPGFVSFHNSYLDYAVEIGIPGFLVVMGLLGYTYIRSVILALFVARTRYIKAVAWFMLASLTYLYAQALVEGFMATPVYFGFYWFLFLAALTEFLWRINSKIEETVEYHEDGMDARLAYYQDEEEYQYQEQGCGCQEETYY